MMIEEQVTSLIISKQVELAAKGYSLEQSEAAIKRARKWAEKIASKVTSSSRNQVFISLFESALNDSEDWLSKVRGSGQKWAEGLAAVAGVEVGPSSRDAYERWAS